MLSGGFRFRDGFWYPHCCGEQTGFGFRSAARPWIFPPLKVKRPAVRQSTDSINALRRLRKGQKSVRPPPIVEMRPNEVKRELSTNGCGNCCGKSAGNDAGIMREIQG